MQLHKTFYAYTSQTSARFILVQKHTGDHCD